MAKVISLTRTKKLKILIVEKQMLIAADVSLQLIKLGYDVVGMLGPNANILDAVEIHGPDLILLNIGTAITLDNVLLSRSQLKNHRIPIVYLSAQTDYSVLKYLRDVDVYGLIIKPFDAASLARGISLACDRIANEA